MDKKIPLLHDKAKEIAEKTLNDCTFIKRTNYFGIEKERSVLLPSGDEKYGSFWIRDCAMMAESGLLPLDVFKSYIEIFSACGQNGNKRIDLENGLVIPPYALADHINYDGGAVYYPGCGDSGNNQGDGTFGIYPPFCDNYFYVIMVGAYIKYGGDRDILDEEYSGILLSERLEKAFEGYNIDKKTLLCCCEEVNFTIDWGFVDTVKKSGKLLMASILRHNAAKALAYIFDSVPEKKEKYLKLSETIKNNIIYTFYDKESGWFYSATGICHQYDVWASAYAVFSGITDNEKTLKALYDAYKNGTATNSGYVRHILKGHDHSDATAWESCIVPRNNYQNGAFWATPTGWYAYALYKYNKDLSLMEDFLAHTAENEKNGAPYEWFDEISGEKSGLNYGTSGVLPYIGIKRIYEEMASE